MLTHDVYVVIATVCVIAICLVAWELFGKKK